MTESLGEDRIHPLWWAAIMFAAILGMALVCSGLFAGTFRSFVPVIVTSDRSGLVLEPGAKVMMRGVQVGRVAAVMGGGEPTSLKLELFPDQNQYIPANVEAEIKATTVFGAKYVEFIYPDQPAAKRLSAGSVLRSRNVSTEVNTVFDNLVGLLQQIDVSKLNAVLTALADGVQARGHVSARRPPTPTKCCLPLIPEWTPSRRTGAPSRESATPTALRHKISWPPWMPRVSRAPPSRAMLRTWMRCS